MEDGDREYLVCCPVDSAEEMVWIITLEKSERVIEILEDEITIRNAFVDYNYEEYLLRC